MQLEFFGAAGEVTGSCHILTVNGNKILLDCGMIQGGRKNEARNRDDFPFDTRDIHAVVLSHAHIDHSGRLPLLIKRGFNKTVHCHNATKDLCDILLRDSANLSERDADYENRKRERKGLELIEPLYSIKDAERAIKRLRGYKYRTPFEVAPGVNVQFYDAGHIMGSCVVEVTMRENGNEKVLVFSGDLGQHNAPILRDPVAPEYADIVLMESTYGSREHRNRELTVEEIGEVISEAKANKGNILIPAFAIGRSQEVLYMLGQNYEEWGMKNWRVFLDSPMAIQASKVYWEYPHLYDDEATLFRRSVHEMPRVDNLHLTPSPEESMVINKLKNGAIVIAGSGMCNGGRIMHHLKHNVWRPECHVIIVGYQAPGSLGRRLVERKQHVRIHGETVKVQAKIHTVGGLSAHGDRNDLASWFSRIKNKPPVYMVHGEEYAAEAFQKKLKKEMNAKVNLTQPGLVVDLETVN